MRLDFNQDGQVSMDDVRKNLNQFYDFLKNYDYIEATSRIKSTMYDEALKLNKYYIYYMTFILNMLLD